MKHPNCVSKQEVNASQNISISLSASTNKEKKTGDREKRVKDYVRSGFFNFRAGINFQSRVLWQYRANNTVLPSSLTPLIRIFLYLSEIQLVFIISAQS
jgi:hypothetical protein